MSCLVPRPSGSIDFRDVYHTNGPEMPRQLQNAHAFGSGAECLLILADFQGIILLIFRKLLRTAANLLELITRSTLLSGQLHLSHQITQTGKII